MGTNGADPYRVLGVAHDATEAEIKRAYRALAKRHHPDAGQGSIARFLEIQAAYESLVGGVAGATAGSTRPARAPRRPAQPGGQAGRSSGPGAPGAGRRGPGQGADWASRPRGGSARRPPAGAPGSGGASGAGAARAGDPTGRSKPGEPGTPGAGAPGSRPGSGDPAGRSKPGDGPRGRPPAGDGPRSRRAANRRRATLGSTSYDGAEVFEPDWGGATWYGPTSGTYWTVNPKEYADPRKHGPEYQARARRGRGGPAAGGGAAGSPPGEPPGGVPVADADAVHADTGVPGDAGGPGEPGAGPSPDGRTLEDEGLPPSWRAQTWTAASPAGAGRAAFEHEPAPGDVGRAAWPASAAPPPRTRGPADHPESAPRLESAPRPGPAPGPAGAARIAAGPGVAARVALAVGGWLAPGLALAALAGLPGGFLATLPLQAAGVAVLGVLPPVAWASIGGGIALVFAAIPIVAVVAALGGPFVPGGPAPEAAVVLAAGAWTAGAILVAAGRIAPYPWRADS